MKEEDGVCRFTLTGNRFELDRRSLLNCCGCGAEHRRCWCGGRCRAERRRRRAEERRRLSGRCAAAEQRRAAES